MQETWAIHNVYPGISWTPDNRSIVFWGGGKINRVDVASGAVSDIPFHVTGTRFVEDAVRQQKRIGGRQLRREDDPLRPRQPRRPPRRLSKRSAICGSGHRRQARRAG